MKNILINCLFSVLQDTDDWKNRYTAVYILRLVILHLLFIRPKVAVEPFTPMVRALSRDQDSPPRLRCIARRLNYILIESVPYSNNEG